MGSSPSVIVPSLTPKANGDVLSSPEEDKEFSAAYKEALVESDLEDKRRPIEDEIDILQAYIPKTPQDSINKDKALKAAKLRLKSLTEPKRLNQWHRLKVREIAKTLWQNNSDWTIQKLIENDKVTGATTPRIYSVRTLRNWIKDLAPNRRPGRRTANH